MEPLALMEVVMHHALSQQKKEQGQDYCKQEMSDSERAWFFFTSRRLQVSSHRSSLSARLAARDQGCH